MKQSLKPSAWGVSILSGVLFGGRCDYCNTALSVDALSQNVYQEHRGHIQALSAWMRITRPEAYRGLELKLPVELFVGRDHPWLGNPLHLPAIVFKFSCKLCQVQNFPHSENEMLSFCSRHSSHLHIARLHAIVQNFGGRTVPQAFSLIRVKDTRSSNSREVAMPSALSLSRAAQLRDLCKTLVCSIAGMRCAICQTQCRFQSQWQVEEELPQHEYHLNSLYLQVTIHEPAEFAGLQLEVPAHPFSLSSLFSSDGLKINCVLVELSRQHGGPSVTPWNAAEIGRYIKALQGRNQPKLCALIRGDGGQVFQCEVPVIHGSLPAGSADQIPHCEQWLHPEMEGA